MKQVFMPLLFAFLLSACEEKPKYTSATWMDNNVEACGVSDPLTNLGWLNQKINEPTDPFTLIFLYRDTVMDEPVFVLDTEWFTFIYDCSGKELAAGNYIFRNMPQEMKEVYDEIYEHYTYVREEGLLMALPAPCVECDTILQNCTYQKMIYKYYIINK